jgi:hypothetical protein
MNLDAFGDRVGIAAMGKRPRAEDAKTNMTGLNSLLFPTLSRTSHDQ